jgi:phosphoglycolate phosphatase
MIRAIGFDFDGTLIMSEDKKAIVIQEIFQELHNTKKGISKSYKELVGKGISRENKLKIIFKKHLKKEPTKTQLNKLNKEFSKHYETALNTCPLFECTNIIKELKDQVNFLFLLSLENKTQVKNIAKHCKIAQYFNEILGGPTSKITNLKHILKKHNLKPSQVIYIGDSSGDIIATHKLNVKTILIQKKFSYKKLKSVLQADFVFSSLCELPKLKNL